MLERSSRSDWTGKSLGELGLPDKTGALVVAIIRGDETQSSPGGLFSLEPEDVLVLTGTKEEIDRAIHYLDENEEIGSVE